MKRFLKIACAAVALSACAPKLYGPKTDLPDVYENAAGGAASRQVEYAWWRIFSDPQLDTLMARALAGNHDIAAAMSRIEQARAEFAVARAQYLPAVGADVSAEGSYDAGQGIEGKYSVMPTLSWEISLAGAMKNTKKAALAAVMESEWAYFGTELSLTTELAAQYFTLQQYRRNLAIARSSCRLRRESAALIDSMFRYGMADGVALEQARSLALSAEADIPRYERAAEQTRQSIATLLGVHAADLPAEDIGEFRGYTLAEIPTGLPSDLLHRRPDIMQAYHAMERAAAETGIARAARFPSVTLTASGGVEGRSLQSLTSADPWSWSVLGSLVQPIFSFGRLKRREQAAAEAYRQSVLQYEQLIIEAVAEVESALTGIETYRRQTAVFADFVAANAEAVRMTEALYAGGMVSYLSVIDAQRSWYDSQTELSELTAQCNMACVTLIKALGGGWGYE